MTPIFHPYQQDGIDFLNWWGGGLLLADCGTGKTLMTLEALNRDRRMIPALVVAPLRCVTKVWPEEVKKFEYGFSVAVLHGPERDERLAAGADLMVTNFESLPWLWDRLESLPRMPFKTIVIDEASRVKSPDAARTNFCQAIAKYCEHRILLTGTPIPQGYQDLWSQFFILDRGRTFGTYRNFISKAFDEDYFGRPVLKFGWGERIENKIRPFVFRVDAATNLELPELMEIDVAIDLPDSVMVRYEEVEYGFLAGLENHDEHTEANYAALRCCCSGFLYHTDEATGQRSRENIHKAKLDRVEDIWDENGRKPLLVAFNYRGERELLVDRFGCPFIDGATSHEDADRLIDLWNAGELPMLAIQPLSVGFGLNLQTGGRHLLWFGLPDSGEVYVQTVARLHRQGQTGTVFVYRLICNDTIERAIAGLLNRKLLNQSNLLEAMKRDREYVNE
jgi:SNF2 family DNA or RNA helicase